MKKFYSLLGAFAVAALGAFSTTAQAADPVDVSTITTLISSVSPEPGASFAADKFPATVYIYPGANTKFFYYEDVKDGEGNVTGSEQKSTIDPSVNKIQVTFPDGTKADYPPVAPANGVVMTVSIPNADVVAHAGEGGTMTLTAPFEGCKMYNGATVELPSFFWKYEITKGAEAVVGDEYGLPEGSTVRINYKDFTPGGEVTSANTIVIDYPATAVFSATKPDVTNTIFKKVNGAYTEVVRTIADDYMEKPYGKETLQSWITVSPLISDPGEYRVVITLEGSTVKFDENAAAVKNMSLDFVIPDKPEPVAVEYTIDPAAGNKDVAEMPTEIILTFTNAATFKTSGTTGYFTVTDPKGNAVADADIKTYSGGKFWLTFPKPTMNGEYKCALKTNNFSGTTAEGADLIFPTGNVIEWSYNISGIVIPVPSNIEITPAAGDRVQADFADGKISLTCTDAAYTASGNAAFITINGVKYDKDNTTVTTSQTSNKITFDVPASVFAKGGVFNCEGDLSGVAFLNGGGSPITLSNTTFNWTWTLPEANVLPKGLTVVPDADGTAYYHQVSDFKDGITLTFNGAPMIGGVNNAKLTVNGKDATLTTTIDYPGMMNGVVSGNSLAFSVNTADLKLGKNIVKFNGSVLSNVGAALQTDVEFFYIIQEPAVAPAVLVAGEAAEEASVEVKAGTEVTFGEVAEGTAIYYKWTAAAASENTVLLKAPAEGYTKYTEPIEIREAGTLSYYAENGLGRTDDKTISFTLAKEQVLPPATVIVDPDPVKTQARAWLGTIKITFKNADGVIPTDNSQMISNPTSAYLLINGVKVSGATGDVSGVFASQSTITFNVSENSNVVWNNGFNTVVFYRGDAAPYQVADNYIPETFSFEYNVDDSVAVEGIEIETAADYYTVEGIKVQNPEAGKLYIKVANGKASKVIIR